MTSFLALWAPVCISVECLIPNLLLLLFLGLYRLFGLSHDPKRALAYGFSSAGIPESRMGAEPEFEPQWPNRLGNPI